MKTLEEEEAEDKYFESIGLTEITPGHWVDEEGREYTLTSKGLGERELLIIPRPEESFLYSYGKIVYGLMAGN